MIPSEIKEDALGETKESLGIQNQHFCKECNISFNKGKSLETHADYSHKDVRWEICQVTVGSKYNLIRHKAQWSEMDKNPICSGGLLYYNK